jgi:hypothetical protein
MKTAISLCSLLSLPIHTRLRTYSSPRHTTHNTPSQPEAAQSSPPSSACPQPIPSSAFCINAIMTQSSFYFHPLLLFVLFHTSLASPVRDGGSIQLADTGKRFFNPQARAAAAISITSQPFLFPQVDSATVPAPLAKRQTVIDAIEFTLDVPVQVANDVINGPSLSGTLTTTAMHWRALWEVPLLSWKTWESLHTRQP